MSYPYAGGAFVPGADYTGASFNTPTIASPTITSPTITGTTTIGAGSTITSPAVVTPTISGVTTASNTLTDASYAASVRYLASVLTLTPATTITVTGSNSLAATSGQITLSAGKTIQDGFYYGTRGKFVGTTGTFNQTSAGRITGVIGQVDLGSMTITAGQVSCVWADLQGSPTISNTEVNILRVTNSSSQTVNAMAFFYGQSTYFATMGRDGGTPTYFAAASDTTISKKLKINVSGTDYWIALTTSV